MHSPRPLTGLSNLQIDPCCPHGEQSMEHSDGLVHGQLPSEPGTLGDSGCMPPGDSCRRVSPKPTACPVHSYAWRTWASGWDESWGPPVYYASFSTQNTTSFSWPILVWIIALFAAPSHAELIWGKILSGKRYCSRAPLLGNSWFLLSAQVQARNSRNSWVGP